MERNGAWVFLVLSTIAGTAQAGQLVYEPVNPAFGGNSLNGGWLLNQANAQNDIEDPDIESRAEQSGLERFNESLQRALLSRLAYAITSNIIGPGGQISPGTVETTDFIIDIVDLGGGILSITTTDKATGETSTFEIDSNL